MLTHFKPAQSHDKEEGFTLLELMIVIVIIGILAAIAIPIFMNQQKGAAEATLKSDLKNASLAIQTEATKTGGKYNFSTLPTNYNSTTGNVIEIKPVTSSTNVVAGAGSSNGASVMRAAYHYHQGGSANITRSNSNGTAVYHTASYGGPYWQVTSSEGTIPAGSQITVSLKLTLNRASCYTNYVEQWRLDNTYGGNAGSAQTCLQPGVPQTVTFTATTNVDTQRITFVNYKQNNPGDEVSWEEPVVVMGDTLDTTNVNASPDAKYCVQGYSEADPTKIWSYTSTIGKVKEGRC